MQEKFYSPYIESVDFIYKINYLYTKKQLNAMFPTPLFRSLKKKAETEIFLLKSRQYSVCSLIAVRKVLTYISLLSA